MLAVISPAKTLDFETPALLDTYTQPGFLKHSAELIDTLRALAPDDLQELMGISAQLAELNHARFMNWRRPFRPGNAKQAVLAFRGDVYTGLDADSFSADDFAYAQDHLRILSGLYGVLRPLDLMQPYRLEMGTRLANGRGRNLYEFWGERITDALNATLGEMATPVLVNLASDEYFKSVQPKKLRGELITPVFKDLKNGSYKIVSFYAKKARGMMSAFLIKERVDTSEGLKDFAAAGYRYVPELSSDNAWVFTRDTPE